MKTLHQQARGYVQCFVVDAATGSVVRECPRQSNLILNAGMEQVAAQPWASLFQYCAAGTGITPTSDSGGATTASQAGNVVVLSGGLFTFTDTATDSGKVIKWATNEEAQIVSITNPTTAVVNSFASVGAAQFVVYRTNQTQLGTELKRTNTYLTGAPNCQTIFTLVTNIFAMRRTYDFTAEVAPVNYTEVGVGWSATAPANLFSRILLGAPVAVAAGQLLRVTYELQLTLFPLAAFAKTASISGWPVAPALTTNGTEALQLIGLQQVSTSGSVVDYDNGGSSNEPSSASGNGIFLSTDDTAPAATGSSVNRSAGANYVDAVSAAYMPSTYYTDKTGVFLTVNGNGSNWSSMGYGAHNPNLWFAYDRTTMVFVFTEDQTKDNTFTLTLTWRFSWSRVLS